MFKYSNFIGKVKGVSVVKRGVLAAVLLIGLLVLMSISVGCQKTRNQNEEEFLLTHFSIMFNDAINDTITANISEANKVPNKRFRDYLNSEIDSINGLSGDYNLTLKSFLTSINAVNIEIRYNSNVNSDERKSIFQNVTRTFGGRWYVGKVLFIPTYEEK